MAVFICLMIIQILCYIPLSLQLDYLCRPNGSFVVNNPDNTKYRMVEVKDDQKKCSTTIFSADYKTLQIDGCEMNHYVTLVFIKGSQHPIILTKNNFVAFRIMCRRLPPGGIEILVSTSLGVRNHVEEFGDVENTEITRVFSNIEDSDPIPPVTVSMTDKFEWHIQVKENQHALPITCAAYAGKTLMKDAEHLVLMENGCSSHDEVLSSFSRVPNTDGTNSNRFAIQFYAFRFNDNPFITVVCSIRICDESSNTDCKTNCNNKFGRRRRELRRQPRDSNQVTDMSLVMEVLDKRPIRGPEGLSRDRGSDVMDRMIYDLTSRAQVPSFHLSLLFLMATITSSLSC